MAKSTATPAAAGAAAPVAPPTAGKATKPAHHHPTPPRPRDEYTGKGGTYTRDPATGQRTPVKPAAPTAGADTPAEA